MHFTLCSKPISKQKAKSRFKKPWRQGLLGSGAGGRQPRWRHPTSQCLSAHHHDLSNARSAPRSHALPPHDCSQLSVCSYQVLSDASMLPKCGHTFCQQCIVSAMGEKRECPMCRAAQPPHERYSASLSFAAGSARCGAGWRTSRRPI